MTRAEIFVSDIPAAVFHARVQRTIKELRAARPGQRSRKLFALATEDALWSGNEMRRAASRILRSAAHVDRPGVPRRDVQARLNAILTGGAR